MPGVHILADRNGTTLMLTNIDEAFNRSHGIGHTDCILAEGWPAGLVRVAWSNQG